MLWTGCCVACCCCQGRRGLPRLMFICCPAQDKHVTEHAHRNMECRAGLLWLVKVRPCHICLFPFCVVKISPYDTLGDERKARQVDRWIWSPLHVWDGYQIPFVPSECILASTDPTVRENQWRKKDINASCTYLLMGLWNHSAQCSSRSCSALKVNSRTTVANVSIC